MLSGRAAKLAEHFPAHPQQQQTTRQRQPDDRKELAHQSRKQPPECDGAGNPQTIAWRRV